MDIGSDYKIEKLEKGALQRFKNQNLLNTKFGEVGLQVYKAITGKRSSKELRSDLDMDDELLTQMLNYMEEAGMIILTPAGPGKKAKSEEEEISAPKKKKLHEREEAPEEEGGTEEELAPVEEITEDEEQEAPETEEEFTTPKKKKKGAKKEAEEIFSEEGITPALEIEPEFSQEVAPKKGRKKPIEEDLSPAREIEEEAPAEEIVPEFVEETFPEEDKAGKKKKTHEEEETYEEEEKAGAQEGEEAPEEETPEEEASVEEKEKKEKEEVEFAPEEISFGEEEISAAEEEKPVEKIIKDKYGDIGLRVYTLIDGQRTAEEIMNDTGLSEAKLVEILDFLDEQGIIKLEYPRGKAEAKPVEEAAPKELSSEGYTPMIEEEEEGKGMVKDLSPDLIPIRPPLSIVKSVQVRAKTMLRYSDIGDRTLSAIDGKADVIDLALSLNINLYKLMEVLNFLRDEGGVILNPIPRTEIRRKYGDDGFNIYKRFGKEGIMLYELIGKEMTIKDMADRITTNKAQVVDMFLFIYEVLGIELPLNKDALMKQLGL